MPGYTITSDIQVNDEGSDFATVTITLADGSTHVERFASYFDSPSESAVVQAASYVCAFEEAAERRAKAERLGVHPLEIAFEPYGSEWEHEMTERYA